MITFWRNVAATADHLELKLSEGRICHLGWLIVGHHCGLCPFLSIQGLLQSLQCNNVKSAVYQDEFNSDGRPPKWAFLFVGQSNKGLWAVLLQIALLDCPLFSHMQWEPKFVKFRMKWGPTSRNWDPKCISKTHASIWISDQKLTFTEKLACASQKQFVITSNIVDIG